MWMWNSRIRRRRGGCGSIRGGRKGSVCWRDGAGRHTCRSRRRLGWGGSIGGGKSRSRRNLSWCWREGGYQCRRRRGSSGGYIWNVKFRVHPDVCASAEAVCKLELGDRNAVSAGQAVKSVSWANRVDNPTTRCSTWGRGLCRRGTGDINPGSRHQGTGGHAVGLHQSLRGRFVGRSEALQSVSRLDCYCIPAGRRRAGNRAGGRKVLVGEGEGVAVWVTVGVKDAVKVGAPGSRGGSVAEGVAVADGGGVGEGGKLVGSSTGS
jgi:hypothetical protein